MAHRVMPYRISRESEMLPAMHRVRSPRTAQILARLLLVFFLVLIVVLIFTPWQQNVFGTGSVIAFEPIERQQNIEALLMAGCSAGMWWKGIG